MILVVFKAPGPEMCTFGVLGLLCEATPKPPGFSHDNPEKVAPPANHSRDDWQTWFEVVSLWRLRVVVRVFVGCMVVWCVSRFGGVINM